MSSEFVPFPPPPPVEGLYLVGFRLDPAHEGPEFYTVFALEGENERPIASGDRVIFFRDPRNASVALEASDNGVRDLGPAPTDLEMLCDISQALYVANSEDTDEDGVLFDTIAVLDDLVRTVKLNVPAEYMAVLSAVAAQLEESHDLAAFLTDQGIDRERLEDAIIWCVGAVAVKSSWV